MFGSMKRREVLWAAMASQALFIAPAEATRVPVPKDRRGYSQTIDHLCHAWWKRDFNAFEQLFRHAEVDEPFDARPLFDERYSEGERRFRGPLLFNGSSAVLQIVTPQAPDHERGFGGGYALADLFLVKFFPGIDQPIIEKLQFIDDDLLAAAEWKKLPGAHGL